MICHLGENPEEALYTGHMAYFKQGTPQFIYSIKAKYFIIPLTGTHSCLCVICVCVDCVWVSF